MKKLIFILLLFTGLSYSQTNLSAASPATTFGGILHLDGNTGLTSTLQTIYDGLGNATKLQLSTNGINVIGSLYLNGVAVGAAVADTPVSVNYSISTLDHFVECTAGVSGITVTLPTAVGNRGLSFVITKVDSGVGRVTIATTSGQTINGSATYVIIYQYVSITLHSNGSNWIIN